jgi:hypothetical protein
MSNGPIEFMGEGPAHEVPASELGGADGLIQPPPHEMTASEANAAIMRASLSPVDSGDQVIDPATGRVVDARLISGA